MQIADVDHRLTHEAAVEDAKYGKTVTRRAMTPVGLMSLRTTTTSNLLVPAMTVLLDSSLSKAALAGLLEERLTSTYHRLRSVSCPPHFVEDPQFDVRNHIFEHNLDNFRYDAKVAVAAATTGHEREGLDTMCMQRLVGLIDELSSHPLATKRPMWEMHMIHRVDARGRCALLWRVHHSVADGISLGYALYSLFDQGWDELHASVRGQGKRSAADLAASGSSPSAQRAGQHDASSTRWVPASVKRMLRYVRDEHLWHSVWMLVMTVAFVARLLLLFPFQVSIGVASRSCFWRSW